VRTQPLRLGAARAHVIVEPVYECSVPRRFFGEAHEQAARLALRSERQRGADDPAIYVLQQVVALGGCHEFRRQHFLALGVDHSDQDIEHSRVIALQAGHRLLHQPEAVLHQGRLDVFDPYLVVRLHTSVGVGFVGRDRLIAAAGTALDARFHGISDRSVQLNFTGRYDRESNCARHRYGLVLDAEDVLLSACQQLLAPSFDVVLVAALEQHEKPHATQATHDFFRMQGFLQQLCEFDQHLFAGEGTDVTLDGAELVELDDGDTPHASGSWHSKAFLQRFQHLAPV
jgi:hypothetical protein